MRSSINSFELMQLKPNDRYSLLYYRVFDEIRQYTNHINLLERVLFLESMLKPLYEDLESEEFYGPHTRGYIKWRENLINRLGNTDNYFAVAHTLLGELVLVARENGLIGGDDGGILALISREGYP